MMAPHVDNDTAMSLTPENGHNPVMLQEVVRLMAPHCNGTYLDGTFGGGGYTRALIAAGPTHVFALDRDPDAIARGKALGQSLTEGDATTRTTFEIRHGNFRSMDELFADVAPFDGIVLDLGVSSFQLDQAERGFSFRQDGPLDMRMSQAGESAEDLVNTADESDLADILYHYGEERLSRRVAGAIVTARGQAPIRTTGALAEIIRRVVRPDRSRIDPATRSFQALRIAVNDELGDLERVLEVAPTLLRDGGRFVVVTFHSLEDRLVKRALLAASGRVARPSRHLPSTGADSTPAFTLPRVKPVLPTEDEIRANPRARSAKIRILEKTRHIIEPLEGTAL